MNRSILIVICDFLLISLLAFSTVDINKVGEEGAARPLGAAPLTNAPPSNGELAAVMQLALEDEQRQRELLQGELAATRQTSSEREQALQHSQKELAASRERLQATEQQRVNLQDQFSTAQTNLARLNQQLQLGTAEAQAAKAKLSAMEAELQKRAEAAAALQTQLSQLASSNQAVLNEKQQLASRLQVVEVEKRHATEQVVAMKEQVKVEREEKARLVEGVKALATNSTQLAQEIRENRPLAPNTIFDEFMANRVRARFAATRPGLFDTDKQKTTDLVFVAHGSNIFALCHVEDTPLTFWIPGVNWRTLTGTLSREQAEIPIGSLSFLLQDPRIVFVPVSQTQAKQLGAKVYQLSTTPFKFQDAVLVGTADTYYGECRFEIDPGTPAYVKLDRSLLRGLFGKFNPSRGDLVFSKTGELLGIMANSTYCLLVKNFDATATFTFGPDIRSQKTGDTLAALYTVVHQLPLKLQ